MEIFLIIISKRKDYYDYLTGIYGRDEKKVFNRRDDIIASEIYFEDVIRWRNYNIYDILICNRRYRVEQVSKGVWELHKFHKDHTDMRGNNKHFRESQVAGLPDYVYYIDSSYNSLKEGQPIRMFGTYHKNRSCVDATPILSTFGIPAVYEAVELYANIDMCLGHFLSLKETRSVQNDEEKLLAKGFDNKISFRNQKNRR